MVAPEGVITGAAGIGLTVTFTEGETPEQPLASVTVIVNVPDAITLIELVFAPLLHKFPLL